MKWFLYIISMLLITLSSMATDVSTRRAIVTQQRILKVGMEASVGSPIQSVNGENIVPINELINLSSFVPVNDFSVGNEFMDSIWIYYPSNPTQAVYYYYADLGNYGDPQFYTSNKVVVDLKIERGTATECYRGYHNPNTNIFVRGLVPMDTSFEHNWGVRPNVGRSTTWFSAPYPIPTPKIVFTNGISGFWDARTNSSPASYCDTISAYRSSDIPSSVYLYSTTYYLSNSIFWNGAGNPNLESSAVSPARHHGFNTYRFSRYSTDATGEVHIIFARPY